MRPVNAYRRMKLAWMALVVTVGCGAESRSGDDGSSGLTIVAAEAPAAVIAYRDGDGAWATTTGAMSPISIPIATGTYTVAITCPLKSDVDVYEMTLAELSTLTYRKPCVDSSTTISGSLDTPTTFLVAWGATSTYPGSGSSYVISVPPGTHDLVAGRSSLFRDRLIIARDLAVSASVVHPLDFAAPDAITVEFPAVTPTGTYESTLITAGGTAVDLGLYQDRLGALPATAMRPDDLLMVTTRGAGGDPTLASVISTRHIAHLPPSSMQLPPVLRPPATPRAYVTGGTSEFVEVSWQPQPTASLYVLTIGFWSMHMSPMAFAARPSIANPDLANVPGWDPARAIHPMQSQAWSLRAESGGSLEDLVREVPAHEMEIHSSGWAGNIRL
ncbi:hypothetical protein BH11MYX3_BH11MYX3_02790 [soil metagenome]